MSRTCNGDTIAFARRLRQLRRSRGVSARWICRESGITSAYMSHLEQSKCVPSATVLQNLADVFGLTMDELWRGVGRCDPSTLDGVEHDGEGRQMKTPLVFLDIDGVLNDHACDPMSMCGEIHSAKVRLLNRLLFRSGARLVLSTAWRYIVHRGEANLIGMDWLLRSHGLHAGRLVGAEHDECCGKPKGPLGVTRLDTMERSTYQGVAGSWPMCDERGYQITDWRAEHEHVGPYVVIDDLDLGITAAGHPLVHTDGSVGLTERDADTAVSILYAAKGGRP